MLIPMPPGAATDCFDDHSRRDPAARRDGGSDTEASQPPRAFELCVTVDASHIDAQGHASNVAYLDWMNRAAIAHSELLGFAAADYQRLGAMFVVKRHEIDYLAAARLGDRLTCRTWCETMDKATAVRRHEILRTSDGACLVRGLNVWAFVDIARGRPTRIPAEIVAAFTGMTST